MADQPLVNLDLAGRTALVTGGASGIGLACARRLAQAGAEVTILDLDGDKAAESAESIGASSLAADLTDPEVLGSIGEQHAADIIVNNAGFQRVTPIEDFDPEVFVAIQRVMVEAPFRLVRAALPRMYEQGWGRVINISSAHGRVASAYKVAYVTAKHALEGLSKVIATEGGGHGVTSNCIAPGYVRTPLVEKQIADQAKSHGIDEDEVVEKIMLPRSSVKRLLEPEEVAELAAYLCSPLADCVNGSSYAIDGGWTAC